MKKMLSIALCAAMILSFAASVSASSPRRTLSNKNMPIATSKEEDLAEAASLYAEYAMDFATQAMQYALIVALTAMDLQRNAEKKKEEQTP